MENANSYSNPHAGTQQKRVPEEGKISRAYTIFHFLHALQAFSMTTSPLDAVSAAGPLCTHGKGVGSKSRNRVRRVVGCFFDEKITKNERNTITSWIRPPQGPSLVGSRHAGYIYKFQKSYVFEKKKRIIITII